MSGAIRVEVDLGVLDAVRASLSGAGDDPRYSEDFLLAKREIDKLKDNDYALAHERCRVVLAQQAKDLRIAGYLVMAALGCGGLPGLLEAAEGYRLLLELHWENCHPRKESQRLSALDWLNGARLEALARAAGRTAAQEERAPLRRCVDEINALLRARLGDQAPQWRSLDSWLNVAAPARTLGVAPPQASSSPPTPEEVPPVAHPRTETAVASDREAFALSCALSAYWREQGKWTQALAYTRALRWGALVLPPSAQGRTRVPAPRAGALSALDLQRQAEDPIALLQLCEALFLEPGGQFWLDLQYLFRQAARACGRCDLEQFIDGQTGLLIKRFPELATLSFEDGRPFADPATRAWLGELRGVDRPQRATSAPDAWDAQLADALQQARDLASRKKLGEALQLLRALPTQTQLQRVRLHLAEAALCLQGGRPEIALPLVQSLEEQSETLRVELWDEGLALEIWRLALETRQQCVRQAAAEEKAALDRDIRRLRARICVTDPAAALQWL